MTVRCEEIVSAQTWPLRSLVLRPGLPLETCRWDGDDLPTTHHYGLVEAGEVVGIASIYQRPHDAAPGPDSWQLRGMATDPQRQNEGLGAILLRHVLTQCRDALGGRTMWCNARTRAVPFYRREGFSTVGEEFMIAGVGPHFVMVRPL